MSFRRQRFVYRLVQMLAQIAVRPGSTALALRNDPAFLRYGVGAWLLMGLMYTFTVLVGYLHGFSAVVNPCLREVNSETSHD